MDDRADFAVDDDAARFCERAEVLVVPTDERDPALARAREAAAQLATAHESQVVPAQLDRPKMMDRLQVGEGPAEMVERVAALQTDRPAPGVLVVDDDRHVRLMTTDDLSINEGRTSP